MRVCLIIEWNDGNDGIDIRRICYINASGADVVPLPATSGDKPKKLTNRVGNASV